MDIAQPKDNLAGTFLEIARTHVAEKPPELYTQFCQGDCFCDQPHTCEDHGLDEWYRCTKCGSVKVVRVR